MAPGDAVSDGRDACPNKHEGQGDPERAEGSKRDVCHRSDLRLNLPDDDEGSFVRGRVDSRLGLNPFQDRLGFEATDNGRREEFG